MTYDLPDDDAPVPVTAAQIADWLDALPTPPLYPGLTKRLEWPDFALTDQAEDMARERGWTLSSFSFIGVSLVYRKDLIPPAQPPDGEVGG